MQANIKLTKDSEPIKYTKKQLRFVENYYNPTSDTFGDRIASAIKAGFGKSYARVIGSPSVNNAWLEEAKKHLSFYTADHIYYGLQEIAKNGENKEKLRALELMGKANGMFIDRQQREVSVTFKNEMPRPETEIIEGEVVE